jgi:putative transposase
VLSRGAKKPKIRALDRVVLVLASAFTPTWRDAILVVNPDTVLRWACWWCVSKTHQARYRQGFRLFWAHKSRRRKKPQPKISATTIALIKRMAAENRTWGAE